MYRNSNLSDEICDYLLMNMAKVHSMDRKASFLFVGDLIAHHEAWLEYCTTNLHGRSARDFVSSL